MLMMKKMIRQRRGINCSVIITDVNISLSKTDEQLSKRSVNT
jgi:hypothetical protein